MRKLALALSLCSRSRPPPAPRTSRRRSRIMSAPSPASAATRMRRRTRPTRPARARASPPPAASPCRGPTARTSRAAPIPRRAAAPPTISPRRPAPPRCPRPAPASASICGSISRPARPNLTAAARAQAQVFARSLLMPQLRNMRFLIEGHTDSVGVRARNIDLSQRRAQTLADFLAAAGVGARPAGGARLRPRPAAAGPALNRRREPPRRGGAHFLGRPPPARPAPSPGRG